MRSSALPSLLALSLAGCGSSTQGSSGTGGPGAPAATVTRTALDLRPVDWNPNAAKLGSIAAVTDLAETTALFSDHGLTVLIAGAVSATDASVTAWQAAGVIPAADGNGQWMVGVDAKGALYAVEALSQLARVSDRYGLDGQAVRAVAALDKVDTAFRLDAGLAVASGAQVTQYALALGSLAGSFGRAAGVSSGAVHVFDLATGQDSAYPLAGAAFATLDVATGSLVAATAHALYGEDGKGSLALLIDLGAADVHGLAAAPGGVWVALDGELGLLSNANGTLGVSAGAKLPANATLTASSSGDVWALSAGALTRYTAASPGDESSWTAAIEPVFTRVCSNCHLPGGTANTDLSYYGAWVARRQLIHQRVIDKMPTPMPPLSSGLLLTTADTSAIEAWTEGLDADAGAPASDGGW